MTDKQRMKRNLAPHRPARAAMWLFGERYSKQSKGSMDFWDSLSDSDKELCRRLVREVLAADDEKTA